MNIYVGYITFTRKPKQLITSHPQIHTLKKNKKKKTNSSFYILLFKKFFTNNSRTFKYSHLVYLFQAPGKGHYCHPSMRLSKWRAPSDKMWASWRREQRGNVRTPQGNCGKSVMRNNIIITSNNAQMREWKWTAGTDMRNN